MRIAEDVPKHGLAASIFSCDSSRLRRASAVARSGPPWSASIETLPRADPCLEALDLARTKENWQNLSPDGRARLPQLRWPRQLALDTRQY